MLSPAPNDASVYVWRCEAYLVLGDIEAAASDCDEALRLDPNSAPALCACGKVLYERGEFDRALVEFDKAVGLDPRLSDAFATRSLVHQRQGRLRQAIADAEKSVRLEPNDAVSRNNRGFMRMKSGDYAGAAEDYREAIRLNPEHPNAYKNLAWLQATCAEERFRSGQDALRNALRAMDLSGWKQSKWLEILAAAYAESRDFRAALEWQEKALAVVAAGDRVLPADRLMRYKLHEPWRELPTSVE